jgi:hypothetical protein
MIGSFIALLCIACSWNDDNDANYNILESVLLECPEGAHGEYQSLGEKGVMLLCIIDHGLYVTAENGYAILEGKMEMGKHSYDDVKLLNKLGQPAKSNYDALRARGLECSSPAKLIYRPWGPNGLMAICQVNHGPFVVARNGRVVLKGENDMGEPTIVWKLE